MPRKTLSNQLLILADETGVSIRLSDIKPVTDYQREERLVGL